jgi:nanoRNase/pAp phosphatase (c-di-AMP/oligoRNAs hydrolase)
LTTTPRRLHSVKCLVISDHRVFYGALGRSVGSWTQPHYWLRKGERTPYPDLENVFRGNPADPETYKDFDPEEEHVAVLFYRPRSEAERIACTIEKVLPKTNLLFFSLDEDAPSVERLERVRVRSWDEVIGSRVGEEIRALVTGWSVEHLRAIFEEAQKVGILIQNDPDPDALASALALRVLLGRNRVSAHLISFGHDITRPENREMSRLLNLSVEWITPADLEAYDKLACVDIQPVVFGDRLGGREIDAVIDHHPEQPGYRSRYRDVRTSYGATSTIMTEYMLAAGLEIKQRLATALLYGIKTDTLFLGRQCCTADILAFQHLYGLANLNMVRRMENPEIPAEVFKTFGKALLNLELDDGLSFAFLGPVREDVIPQMAELLLQVDGAQWSVAAGLVDGNVVASVRNAGFQRSAGEVTRKVFGPHGSAGGHRTMAKLVVPIPAFKKRWNDANAEGIRKAFFSTFLQEATRGASGDERVQESQGDSMGETA